MSEKPVERRFDSVVRVLAYFAANRNFGYVDVLANALDPLTAKETLINAVRDFMSACSPDHKREPKPDEVPCPSVDPKWLEYDLNLLLSSLEAGGDAFFLVTRSLALRALARAAALRFSHSGSSGGDEQ